MRESNECDDLVSVNPPDLMIMTVVFAFSAEFWIGLSKNDDTWSWINGDSLIYSNWGESKPWSYPVVRYQDDAFTKWDDTVLGSIDTAGTLCMKGEPLDPFRPKYTQRFSMTDMQRYHINGGGNTRIGSMPGNSGKYVCCFDHKLCTCDTGRTYNGGSAQKCCEHCAAELPDTKFISYKHEHKSKCYCFSDPNPPICNWNGAQNGVSCHVKYYVSGTCAFPDSGRKKRNVDKRVANEIVSIMESVSFDFRNTSNDNATDIFRSKKREHESSLIRKKRNAEDSVVRQITCEPLWGGTAGYWGYPYTVPEYCFSE